MITLQHALVTLLAFDGNIEKFEKQIPYILFPDAIRKYTGNRSCSHFEQDIDGKDVSWIKFPTEIKELDKIKTKKLEKYKSKNLSKGVLCGKNDIEMFEKTNLHLNKNQFYGIKKHLIQDDIFDDFIREQIDTTGNEKGLFKFKQQELTGKEVRDLILDIENYGVYLLASIIYIKYGITTDQKWFDTHVRDILKEEYPEELAESTYAYMKIPKKYNKLIVEHKGRQLQEGKLDFLEYLNMYKKIAQEMRKIDKDEQEKEEFLVDF